MKVGINGRFLAARVSGVQRFSLELTSRLSHACDCVLLLPAGAAAWPSTSGMPVRNGRLRGHAWEQLELTAQAQRAGCTLVLHPANTAPVSGRHHVLMLHDALPITNPEWYTRRFAMLYRQVQLRSARNAAAVLTTSSWAAAQIADALSIDRAAIHVVPQGLAPFDAPADDAAIDDVLARFRLRRGDFLLAVGAGDARKNVAFLGDVLRLASDLGVTLPPLAIVGDAPGHIFRQGRPLHHAGVRMLGRVTDGELHALLSSAAVFCFPSLAEGFGRPPLEAMACGTPVIAAPYGAAEEMLGAAASMLPLEPDSWLQELVRLTQDEAYRGRRIEAGRQRAQMYCWNHTVRDTLAVLRTLEPDR